LHPAVERDAEELEVLLEVGQERLGALRQADVVERAAREQVPLLWQATSRIATPRSAKTSNIA
jgi:hypothetical protein